MLNFQLFLFYLAVVNGGKGRREGEGYREGERERGGGRKREGEREKERERERGIYINIYIYT